MYYKSLGFSHWTGFKSSMLIVMSYSMCMCTLSREIYSKAVEITTNIGTSAIGKMT